MLRRIGASRIGVDQPLFVVAELGLNHGGSLDRALALVDGAADAGASAIKLQTLVADRLVTASAPPPRHLGGSSVASLPDFFRQFELDESQHRAIVGRARARGLCVLSTPLSEEAVDLLEAIGIDGYKIASGDLTYAPLIERAAQSGRPLILSTGMSELDEVAAAIGVASNAGAVDLALLQCVSCYPVPPGQQNLRAIQELARAFGLPVGLSDHSRDPLAAALAVALGATIYEKHLVLTRDDDAVDAAVSATPEELAAIIGLAERARQALGDGRKICLPIERVNRVPSRRSLRAARALRPGDVIGRDDIVALRPGDGLETIHWPRLAGAAVRRPIGRHERFLAEDLPEAPRKASHVA